MSAWACLGKETSKAVHSCVIWSQKKILVGKPSILRTIRGWTRLPTLIDFGTKCLMGWADPFSHFTPIGQGMQLRFSQSPPGSQPVEGSNENVLASHSWYWPSICSHNSPGSLTRSGETWDYNIRFFCHRHLHWDSMLLLQIFGQTCCQRISLENFGHGDCLRGIRIYLKFDDCS